MRVNLIVPYDEKDQAKALGARWDGIKKTKTSPDRNKYNRVHTPTQREPK